MEFYTQNGMHRPVRLSEATRQFAYDSLNHRYGLDTLRVKDIPLDDIPGIEGFSELEKYDEAVRQIAAQAPAAASVSL